MFNNLKEQNYDKDLFKACVNDCIGICGADAMMESGHWFVLMCMVILPIALFLFACRSGMVDDVLEWVEKIEEKLKTY